MYWRYCTLVFPFRWNCSGRPGSLHRLLEIDNGNRHDPVMERDVGRPSTRPDPDLESACPLILLPHRVDWRPVLALGPAALFVIREDDRKIAARLALRAVAMGSAPAPPLMEC